MITTIYDLLLEMFIPSPALLFRAALFQAALFLMGYSQ